MKPLRVALEEAAKDWQAFLPASRPMLWLQCHIREWDGGCDRNRPDMTTLLGIPIIWDDERGPDETA